MEVERGLSILLVEDEEPLRRLIQRILESAGYEVVAAESAEQARDLFRRDPQAIRLVITDIELPGRSGRDLAVELKAERHGLLVLLVSGNPNVELRHGAEVGIAFLEKPFSPEDLLRAVRDLFKGDPP